MVQFASGTVTGHLFVTLKSMEKQNLRLSEPDLIARQLNQLGEALAALGIPFTVPYG